MGVPLSLPNAGPVPGTLRVPSPAEAIRTLPHSGIRMTSQWIGGILLRMVSIPAIYDSGVFRPLSPVDLAEGTRATVIPLPTGSTETPAGWPPHYFDQTAGALSGEAFERPPQGELPQRDHW